MTRIALSLWGTALALYAAFWLWYVGIPNPLTPAEVDAALAQVEVSQRPTPAQMTALRAFLEADDGGEFFMLNLVRMQPGEVEVPGGGAREPAPRALERYTGPFLGALLRRAGHPAFVAPAAGTYLERWNVAPDPGWSFAGVIRYRSRRDMIELVTDPAFEPWHAHKLAAIATTLAFPVAPARVWIGPRIWVALVVALLALALQLQLSTHTKE